MADKVTRIDSLSPATNDVQYYGRIRNDTHFDITDVFNTIVVVGFLAVLLLYSTVL
jgi:chromatin segregation and condensation protein Rec8/ScpA/Scc1 (kleisin family)